MPKGFFASSSLAKTASPRVARCGECGLYKSCRTPRMPITGDGRKQVLIVAEAPGKEEDARGVQLIGESGQLLRKHLRRIGVDLDKDCWKTNSVICRPPKNETPDDKRIEACRPNLLKTIEDLNPRAIILLGGVAVKSLLGYLWKPQVDSLSRWLGWGIPCQQLNTWIHITWNPAWILRQADNPVRDQLFQRDLSAAFKHSGRPWTEVPDFRKNVKILLEPREVVKRLRSMMEGDRELAFDYETNMLKPDNRRAEIVSCAVSDGETAIAYPWHGEAITATKEFLESNIPKIAANLKFEERWTRAILHIHVRNWVWDTMLAAHVLNSWPKVTGLKFQSFVQLGMPAYDDHIEPYLEETKNGVNQIHKVDLRDLLLYNGLDALLEHKLAYVQRNQLGYKEWPK